MSVAVARAVDIVNTVFTEYIGVGKAVEKLVCICVTTAAERKFLTFRKCGTAVFDVNSDFVSVFVKLEIEVEELLFFKRIVIKIDVSCRIGILNVYFDLVGK